MKKLLTAATLVLLCLHPVVRADELTGSMREAFTSFERLQGYLVDAKQFSDPAHRADVTGSLTALRSSIHSAQGVSTKYRNDPFFASNLSLLHTAIDDAIEALKRDQSSYAFWRLRGIATNCMSCHAIYNATLPFAGSATPLPSHLSPFQRAQFFTATRQYDKAIAEIEGAVSEPGHPEQKMSLLRQWLVVRLRTEPTTAGIASQLNTLMTKVTLPGADREEVLSWERALRSKQWEDERKGSLSLTALESILMNALRSHTTGEGEADVVAILRVTSSLHRKLSEARPTRSERAHLLYLLGLAYDALPNFFIADLPEVYLEQCIREFPGSPDAKSAYRLYRRRVIAEFTGSSGTHLPPDVAAELNELHDVALGKPQNVGRI